MMLCYCSIARCYDLLRDNFLGILIENLLSMAGDNAFSSP